MRTKRSVGNVSEACKCCSWWNQRRPVFNYTLQQIIRYHKFLFIQILTSKFKPSAYRVWDRKTRQVIGNCALYQRRNTLHFHLFSVRPCWDLFKVRLEYENNLRTTLCAQSVTCIICKWIFDSCWTQGCWTFFALLARFSTLGWESERSTISCNYPNKCVT